MYRDDMSEATPVPHVVCFENHAGENLELHR